MAKEFIYDAANRMTQAWGGANQMQFYTYNADGQRTRRKINGQEIWQVYGFEGELLAEYAANAAPAGPQKEYGYRNGQLLMTAEPSVNRALPGLKPWERQWIKDGSWSVDDPLTGGQNMSRSNEHGMTIPGQSQDDAAANADTFINKCVDGAKLADSNWKRRWSLFQFGMAFHTVSDMTSPAHEGYQVWTRRSVFRHRDTEKAISNFRMGLAVGATIFLFRYTYDPSMVRRAVNYTPGSQGDPTVQAIQREYAQSGSNPVAEAEALYEYRLGLQEGLNFDWGRQRGRRGRRQSR